MSTQIRGSSQIIDATVTLAKLEPGTVAGQLLIVGAGAGFRPAYTAMSGDATINSGGTLTIQPDKIDHTHFKTSLYNESGTPYWDFATSATNRRLTGILDPTSAQDAATKNYVDSLAQGLDIKASCRAATTGNINLSTIGLGTPIDGVTLLTDQRVLVRAQTAPAENGIYLAKTTAWVRALDADAWTELPGAFTFVEEGTTLADTGWVCSANSGGILGTTPLTFVQFSAAGAYTASAPITLTGSAFGISYGDGLGVQANALVVELSASTPLKFSSGNLDFGFNSTSFQVTNNSLELKSTVVNSAGGLELASHALAVKLDGTTLSKSASGLRVAAAGITTAEVASATLLRGNMNIDGTGATTSVLTWMSANPGWQWTSIASLIQGRLVTNIMATAVDGTHFQIPGSDTVIAGTESIYVNGIRQRRTTDYTIGDTGNRVITFAEALSASDLVLCDYQK